jgi:hypothetical protein
VKTPARLASSGQDMGMTTVRKMSRVVQLTSCGPVCGVMSVRRASGSMATAQLAFSNLIMETANVWRTNGAVADTLLAPVRLSKETLNGRLSGVPAQLASSGIDGGVPTERRSRASSTRFFMTGQRVGVWAAGNRSSCHDPIGSLGPGWGGGVCKEVKRGRSASCSEVRLDPSSPAHFITRASSLLRDFATIGSLLLSPDPGRRRRQTRLGRGYRAQM